MVRNGKFQVMATARPRPPPQERSATAGPSKAPTTNGGAGGRSRPSDGGKTAARAAPRRSGGNAPQRSSFPFAGSGVRRLSTEAPSRPVESSSSSPARARRSQGLPFSNAGSASTTALDAGYEGRDFSPMPRAASPTTRSGWPWGNADSRWLSQSTSPNRAAVAGRSPSVLVATMGSWYPQDVSPGPASRAVAKMSGFSPSRAVSVTPDTLRCSGGQVHVVAGAVAGGSLEHRVPPGSPSHAPAAAPLHPSQQQQQQQWHQHEVQPSLRMVHGGAGAVGAGAPSSGGPSQWGVAVPMYVPRLGEAFGGGRCSVVDQRSHKGSPVSTRGNSPLPRQAASLSCGGAAFHPLPRMPAPMFPGGYVGVGGSSSSTAAVGPALSHAPVAVPPDADPTTAVALAMTAAATPNGGPRLVPSWTSPRTPGALTPTNVVGGIAVGSLQNHALANATAPSRSPPEVGRQQPLVATLPPSIGSPPVPGAPRPLGPASGASPPGPGSGGGSLLTSVERARSSPLAGPIVAPPPLNPAALRPAFRMSPASQDRSGPMRVEDKLRQWLATIPTSKPERAEPDRQWDDVQISKIAAFAQASRIEHVAAEEIYRQYVVHQVEIADELSVA